MRLASTFTIAVLLFAATAMAEPTAEAIIKSRGGGLEKLQQFGTPEIIIAKRGKTTDDDDVVFNYGPFLVRVHHDTIKTCFFVSPWKGPINGINIGDSRETVVKVLGKPRMVFKNKDGVETDYGYDLKDKEVTLYANFDDEGKVKRVEIGAAEKPKAK